MERIVVPELVRLQEYPTCLALNGRGEFYANPRALIDLESSVARPWDYIVYERLDEMRFALHRAASGTSPTAWSLKRVSIRAL